MYAFCLVGFVVGALMLGGSATAQDASQPTLRAAQLLEPTDGPAAGEAPRMRLSQSGDIRRAPLTRQPARPPSVGQAATIEGDRLRAAPGVVLEMGPNNQVTARRAGGGPLGAGDNWVCECSGTAGSCSGSSSGDIAVCSKVAGNPCLGNCEWDFGVAVRPGGGIMAR